MEAEAKLECQSQPLQRPLLDAVDTDWRTEKLPFEDIEVPQELLPDPEADSTEEAQMTIRDLEQRWTDLDLAKFAETDSNKQ
jgi:hypothetical protein